jgi:hypothetical protein
VLAVGVSPRTGRLTLRLGNAAAAESAYDQGAFTSQVDRLFAHMVLQPDKCACAGARARGLTSGSA